MNKGVESPYVGKKMTWRKRLTHKLSMIDHGSGNKSQSLSKLQENAFKSCVEEFNLIEMQMISELAEKLRIMFVKNSDAVRVQRMEEIIKRMSNYMKKSNLEKFVEEIKDLEKMGEVKKEFYNLEEDGEYQKYQELSKIDLEIDELNK